MSKRYLFDVIGALGAIVFIHGAAFKLSVTGEVTGGVQSTLASYLGTAS